MADEQTDTNTSNETNEQDTPVVDEAIVEEATALGGAGDEPKADEPAASEEVDEAAVVPESYELELEGLELDAALMEQATPLLKEAGLTNEQANLILPIAPKLMEAATDTVMTQLGDAVSEQKADWLKLAKADEDIGGAKWDDTMHLAAKGMDALGFKEGHPFRVSLNETGFGNNRDMIFAFRKMGELVGEDGSFVRDGVGQGEPDRVSEMYPNNRRSK